MTVRSSAFGQILFVFLPLALFSASTPSWAVLIAAAPSPPALAGPTSEASNTPIETGKKDKADALPENLVVVTKVVGEVGSRTVTSREVKICDAIDQVLAQKPVPRKELRVIAIDDKSFVGEVWRVLDQWSVVLEAKSLSSVGPAKADVAKQAQTVWDAWAGNKAWAQLEVSAEELRQMIERRLLAQQFEKLKSDPSLVPISDDDALDYFNKNRLRFGSMPFDSFRDNIKAYLLKVQTERRLNEWRDILRRKYRARNLLAG